MTTTLHTDRVSVRALSHKTDFIRVKLQSSKTRNDETADDHRQHQQCFWRKARGSGVSFQSMAPPAATAPPGVSSSLDARAMERIERVHELRKEAVATGASPLPDYDDVPVRSPKRSHLENIETGARRLSSFRRTSRGRA